MSEFESVNPENTEEAETKKFSPYAPIVAAQAITVAVIIVTLLIVKFLFPSLFSDIKENYKERFLDRTSISEVLDDEKAESEENADEI